MHKEDLVEGKNYRVVDNIGCHEFDEGETVRFSHDDGDGDLSLVCYALDGSDYWYMYPEELEEIE